MHNASILGPTRRPLNAFSLCNVAQVLADGGAAMVEWRLETGRTHQIR
jgi:23S rRNA-/tRNA-specific pseudouridylate synthase